MNTLSLGEHNGVRIMRRCCKEAHKATPGCTCGWCMMRSGLWNGVTFQIWRRWFASSAIFCFPWKWWLLLQNRFHPKFHNGDKSSGRSVDGLYLVLNSWLGGPRCSSCQISILLNYTLFLFVEPCTFRRIRRFRVFILRVDPCTVNVYLLLDSRDNSFCEGLVLKHCEVPVRNCTKVGFSNQTYWKQAPQAYDLGSPDIERIRKELQRLARRSR